MYERIVVPLDGADTAEAAFAYVALLPSQHVRLLRVEPDIEGPLLADLIEWEAWRAGREADARAYLWSSAGGEARSRVGRPVRARERDESC